MIKRPIRFRFVIVTTCLILLSCLLPCGICRLALTIDAIGINAAAQRIGVPPTSSDIYKYIESSIRVGMSRQEVETVLQRIAPIDVQRGRLNDGQLFGCDEIELKLGALFSYWSIQSCYNDQGLLLHYSINLD